MTIGERPDDFRRAAAPLRAEEAKALAGQDGVLAVDARPKPPSAALETSRALACRGMAQEIALASNVESHISRLVPATDPERQEPPSPSATPPATAAAPAGRKPSRRPRKSEPP